MRRLQTERTRSLIAQMQEKTKNEDRDQSKIDRTINILSKKKTNIDLKSKTQHRNSEIEKKIAALTQRFRFVQLNQ